LHFDSTMIKKNTVWNYFTYH